MLGNPLALGYSGPPLRRPIASNELMWLARLLVRVSDAANSALGLDQPPTEAEQHRDGALQVIKLASLPAYMKQSQECRLSQASSSLPQRQSGASQVYPSLCIAQLNVIHI